MIPFSLDDARRFGYLFALMLSAMGTRLILGLARPELGLEQTALVGVTTVLLLAPTLYRLFYQAPMIESKRRLPYVLLTSLSCGLFLFFVARPA